MTVILLQALITSLNDYTHTVLLFFDSSGLMRGDGLPGKELQTQWNPAKVVESVAVWTAGRKIEEQSAVKHPNILFMQLMALGPRPNFRIDAFKESKMQFEQSTRMYSEAGAIPKWNFSWANGWDNMNVFAFRAQCIYDDSGHFLRTWWANFKVLGFIESEVSNVWVSQKIGKSQ